MKSFLGHWELHSEQSGGSEKTLDVPVQPKNNSAGWYLMEAEDLKNGRTTTKAMTHNVDSHFVPSHKLPVSEDDSLIQHRIPLSTRSLPVCLYLILTVTLHPGKSVKINSPPLSTKKELLADRGVIVIVRTMS